MNKYYRDHQGHSCWSIQLAVWLEFPFAKSKGGRDSPWHRPTQEHKPSRETAVRCTVLNLSFEILITLGAISAALSSQGNFFSWHLLTCTEPAKPCYAILKALTWLLYLSCLTLPIWKFPFRNIFSVFSNKHTLSDQWAWFFLICMRIAFRYTCQNLILLATVQTYHKRQSVWACVCVKCENTAWAGKKEVSVKASKLPYHYWSLSLLRFNVVSLQHTVCLLYSTTQKFKITAMNLACS